MLIERNNNVEFALASIKHIKAKIIKSVSDFLRNGQITGTKHKRQNTKQYAHLSSVIYDNVYFLDTFNHKILNTYKYIHICLHLFYCLYR